MTELFLWCFDFILLNRCDKTSDVKRKGSPATEVVPLVDNCSPTPDNNKKSKHRESSSPSSQDDLCFTVSSIESTPSSRSEYTPSPICDDEFRLLSRFMARSRSVPVEATLKPADFLSTQHRTPALLGNMTDVEIDSDMSNSRPPSTLSLDDTHASCQSGDVVTRRSSGTILTPSFFDDWHLSHSSGTPPLIMSQEMSHSQHMEVWNQSWKHTHVQYI